jgi:hypothetical protein
MPACLLGADSPERTAITSAIAPEAPLLLAFRGEEDPMENEQGVRRVRLLGSVARPFRRHGRARSAVALCAAMVPMLAVPAAAQVHLDCSSWKRMSEDRKLQTVERAIEDLVSSSRGREYTSINRTQTRRCLESRRDQMITDFDELCGRTGRADLQALNRTFRSYVWSCAQ